MTEIITIIISVAVGVVVGNLVQGVINKWKIIYLVHRVYRERFEEDPADRQCGDCDGCEGFRCSGEDDE